MNCVHVLILFHSFSAGAFLEAIENLGFDYIASGHYAHVVHPPFENAEGPSVLQLSKDEVLYNSLLSFNVIECDVN